MTSTVYLDVDGTRRPVVAAVDEAFDRLAAELRRQARATNDVQVVRSVDDDIDRMRDWLGNDLERSSTRGVALFACSASGYFDAVPVDIPMRDEATVAPSPRVRQLVERLQQTEPALVALIDGERLRLLSVKGRDIDELGAVRAPDGRASDTSVELGSWAHHHEAAVRTHLHHAADEIAAALHAGRWHALVLGGTAATRAQLEQLLPAEVRSAVAGAVDLPVAATAADVAAATARVLADRRSRHDADAVEDLRQRAAGEHGGVVGLEATLVALTERRVATLLVQDGFEAPGGRCPSCGRLGVDVRRCAACGATNIEVDDVVEIAIEEAVLQRAAIEFCDDGELERFGSIAAIERF